MLVLTRRLEEGIVIQIPGSAESITVSVLGVEGEKVKLGIAAPRAVTVLRQELCEAVRAQNLAAAKQVAPQALASLKHLFPANGHGPA
jgi:carbon storage regulator